MWFKAIAKIIDRSYPENSNTSYADFTKGLNLIIPELRQITKDLGREKRLDKKLSTGLGWAPRPLKDTIIDSTQSLIDLGLV